MSNYRRGDDFRSRSRSPVWDGGGRRRDREWDRDREWVREKDWNNSGDGGRHDADSDWERNREWNRDRDWNLNKERDRNRDRDGEWERDGWRSRGRRDRSPHMKRGRDRCPGGSNHDWDADSSYVAPPSCTLAIKNISSDFEDSMVMEALREFHPVDIRHAGPGMDGEPRQLAFVEFASVDEARAVLQAFPGSSGQRPGGGRLMIDGSFTRIEFAMPRSRSNTPMWECNRCREQNYSHRTVCYRCKTPKPTQSSSQYTTGYVHEPGEIGEVTVPESLNAIVTPRSTSVLLLRGISVHTSEEGIASVLNRFAPVLQVRILRDRATGTPRGAALVQLSCKEHSEHTMDVLKEKSGELEVDGASVKVSYARGESVAALEVEAMNLIDHSPPNLQRVVAGTTSTSPLPAIYGVELGQIAAAAATGQQSENDVISPKLKKHKPVVPPPPKEWPLSFQEAGASYVFEASSGYFLEASTGVYYDPKTKLYFKGGKWYFHVGDKDPPYVPVEEKEEASNPSCAVADVSKQQQPEQHSTTVVPVATILPTSSLVPTDMQRSKKTKLSFGIAKGGGNQHGKAVLGGGSVSNSTIPISTRKRMADISKWAKTKEENSDAPVVPPERSTTGGTLPIQQPTSIADAAVKEAESILTQSYVPPVIDTVKISTVKKASKFEHACTLCQRGFKSSEQLAKHVAKSALHAENVKKTGNRDRAAERRAMHKQGNRPRSISEDRNLERAANAIPPAEPEEIVESASREVPIAGDNIGAQMLQTMGWQEGKGLGRKGKGITAPIEEKATVGTAGVGAQVPMIKIGEHITEANGKQYKAQLRVMAQARYRAAGHNKD